MRCWSDLLGRWINDLPLPGRSQRISVVGEPQQEPVYNLCFSNVPGPRQPGCIGKAPISEFYSVGPLQPGCGMNITGTGVMSINSTCRF